MKIIELRTQNIKNLKAVEIKPDGTTVILTGKNGAGKSAVLDSIFATLSGTRLEDPIRHGEERAETVINLGKINVKKVWTSKGERLEVYSVNEDGKKSVYSSPQQLLDELIGEISFDPLAFSKMKQKDQLNLLRNLVGLNFDDLDKKQQEVFQTRTVINAKEKEILAQIKNIPAPDTNTPNEEISFRDELEKINQLREKSIAYLNAIHFREKTQEQIERRDKKINELKSQIKQIQAEIQNLEDENNHDNRALNNNVLPLKVTDEQVLQAEDKLKEIENINVSVRSKKRYEVLIKDGEKCRQEADGLSQHLKRIEQDKITRVANAKFPVDELSVSDDAVVYQGNVFSRLSTGQQIRVSTTIAMALNPKLRVILIREGSLLDKDGLKEIIKIAEEKDYQVWIEICDESGKVGIFIEDGMIKQEV